MTQQEELQELREICVYEGFDYSSICVRVAHDSLTNNHPHYDSQVQTGTASSKLRHCNSSTGPDLRPKKSLPRRQS